MFNKIKLLSLGLSALLITACASNPTNYIDMEARQHIDEVDAYLAVTQDEIYADIVRSNTAVAAGGGLIFALIDSAVDNSRTKSAEELITPIRNALIDVDYAEFLQASIEENLKDIVWMGVNKVQLERSVGDGQILNKVEESEVSAVLFMTADYKLSANFDSIITSVSLIMFPNKEDLFKFKEQLDNNKNPVDQEDNIYRNTVVVTTPLGVGGTKEYNAGQLAEDNGEKLIKMLQENASMVALEILNDIQQEDTKG